MQRLPRWRHRATRRSESPHTTGARPRVAAGPSYSAPSRGSPRACEGRGGRGPSSVQVVPEHLRTAGVPELGHRLRLDLADPLTRDAVDLADLVEGARLAVGEAEAQPDDAGLPL